MPIPALCARLGGVTIETAMAKPGAQQTSSRPDSRSAGRRDASRRGQTARLAAGTPSRVARQSGPGGGRQRPARSNPAGPEEEPTPAVPTLRGPKFSQSVERGLAILSCFTPERPVLGIADLAAELGMSRSTTHRYALTLTELGYLARARHRKYRLALNVVDLGLGAMGSTSLADHARPYLEELCQRTSYTVDLAVLDGPETVLAARVRSRRPAQSKIDLGLAVGSRLPAHCTAAGKMLLAHLPAEARKAVLDELELTRHGPNTITGKRALAQALREIREDGIATADEEQVPGLVSIAAPVRNDSGEAVAALGMDAHTSMIGLAGLLDHLGPHIVSAAGLVSARLGFRREDETRTERRTRPTKEPQR
jgi:IclR family transcriptional regulator, pca regulon regulatory protein